MNRNRGRGRGGSQGRQGGMIGGNLGRQRQQQLNAGPGILGTGPSMMAMGGNAGQFKQPQPMSPPGGRMRNVSPGMQGTMRPTQNQMKIDNQSNQVRESQLQLMNSLLMKQQQQQQQINSSRASLLNNMESSSLMGNRSNLLGGGFDRNDIDDGRRNSLPGDLIQDRSYHENRRSMPSDSTSASGSGYLAQKVSRSLMDDNFSQDDRRNNRRIFDDQDFGGRSSNLGGRSSHLGDSQSLMLSDSRGKPHLRQDMGRSSLFGDDMNRSSVSVSSRNLLDAGNSLLSNMQQAVFGQEGQRVETQGGNAQSIIGQGNMQSIIGQQGGNVQSLMGQQGGSMRSIMGQQGGNVQSIMGQQGGNVQSLMGQQVGNMQNIMGQQGGNVQGMMGQQERSMESLMGQQGGNMSGMMGQQGGNLQGMMGQQGGNLQGMMGQQGGSIQSLMGQPGGNMPNMRGSQGGSMQNITGQGRPSQNQGMIGPGGGNMQGLLGQGPPVGGKSTIPSLFDVRTNRQGLLGKRTGRGGRDQGGGRGGRGDQGGPKKFRRNSGPSPQDFRRQGNRNDRGSEGRGRSRGTDRRNNRPDRTSTNDRRNPRDSDSSRSRESDRKSHNSDRRSRDKGKTSNVDRKSQSHDRSADKSRDKSADKSHDKSSDKKEVKKEQYDPAEPTEDEENATTELAWIEKKDRDVEMVDLATKADTETSGETKPSTPNKDMDLPDKTMTVTVNSKGRSVDDSALIKKEAKEESSSDKKNFYCHACMVECQDFEGFTRHMKGKKHLNRMESLGSAHNQASEQQASRLKAQEHLRSVEKKPRSEDRKRRDDISPRRGSSDRRSDRERRRRRDRDIDESSNASFPGDLGDMVTVDEIGFEEHDDTTMETEDNSQHGKETKNGEQKGGGKKEPLPEDADDYVIPDYDPTKAVGQKYVVPVSGYFCKLCHKFYTTETSAKTNHCQSKQHYDKFNAVMMDKLITKALAKEEEEEKQTEDASPTEEKKKEETKVKEENVSSDPVNGKSEEKENVSSDDPVNGKNEEETTEEKMEEDTSENPLDSTPTTENETVNGSSENKVEATSDSAEISDINMTKTNQKAKAVKKVAQKAKRGKKT
ncbi:uncharacterized protein LOC127729222 isoform X2 [Mytilus californianus]|uniref:uncharacterized protein LOC127729222 isoform X2 n=1 Tax=Mytilus californianus TaxID=6549 RepID=UPI0022470318|nr:uncharacterized protein LOC127729222 isoform X2 [Mytilus californianus]